MNAMLVLPAVFFLLVSLGGELFNAQQMGCGPGPKILLFVLTLLNGNYRFMLSLSISENISILTSKVSAVDLTNPGLHD